MLQFKKAAIHCNHATHQLWILVRQFNDNVATPGLPAYNRTIEPTGRQNFQQFCKIKSYGLHVVTVIGLFALAMPAQINRNHRVAKRHKCLCRAFPQHGIRSQAMNQYQRGLRQRLRISPPNNAQLDTSSRCHHLARAHGFIHGVHTTLRYPWP